MFLTETSRPALRAQSGAVSIFLHVMTIAAVIVLPRVVPTHTPYREKADVRTRTISLYLPPDLKEAQGGGGGGDRSPTPASTGILPRFAKIQFAPPTVVIRNEAPALPVEPTVIVHPDIKIPQPDLARLGDPMSKILGPASSGPGTRGGIGDGDRGGVGRGRDAGVGPGEGGNTGDGVFKWGSSGVSRPQLVYQVEPHYSDEARRARYQGTVLLQIVVDPDGNVRDPRIVRSLGMGLDEKALEAVQQWRFRPGTHNGAAVPVAAYIEVSFRLL